MPLLCALLVSSAASAGQTSDMKLSLLPSSLPSAKGGRCLDGSMAGYYFRQGSADTFTIFLKGGGACYSEATCTTRSKSPLGSSNQWSQSMAGFGLQSEDCSENPGFCNATAVYLKWVLLLLGRRRR